MQVQKNNLTLNQISKIQWLISKFLQETNCKLSNGLVLQATMANIALGLEQKAAHDTWILGDMQGYCLCRVERDADGKLVYTAYQLWLDPTLRDGVIVRDWIWYLQQHAKDCGYARLYVISSRLDCIKAYARGLGRNFQAQTVTFVAPLGESK